MAEYIERNKLLMELAEEFDKHNPDNSEGSNICRGISLAANIIKSQPATNTTEVKYGKWIGKRGGNRVYDNFKCSICDYYSETLNYYRLGNYCENCGAKLK